MSKKPAGFYILFNTRGTYLIHMIYANFLKPFKKGNILQCEKGINSILVTILLFTKNIELFA